MFESVGDINMSEGVTNGEMTSGQSEFERLKAENEFLKRRIAETRMVLRSVRETLEELLK